MKYLTQIRSYIYRTTTYNDVNIRVTQIPNNNFIIIYYIILSRRHSNKN